MIVAQVIFWICVAAILYSYLFYPLFVKLLSSILVSKKPLVFKENDSHLPQVHILIAVYNEEKVLARKIASSVTSTYPNHKVHVHFGSDGSTDGSNAMLEAATAQYPNVFYTLFPAKTGKIGMVNSMYAAIPDIEPNDILILTDANVFFEPNTIYQLVKRFADPKMGLVGGSIINEGKKQDGIFKQEKSYISIENHIKYWEGNVFGHIMGAFGACYAVKQQFFTPAPANFRSDDFYVSMKVLQNGGKSHVEPAAICYENASDELPVEFQRKVRINMGNYQNLGVFWKMLLPPVSMVAFTFWSHKLLRWLGPFLLIGAFIANTFLWEMNLFYCIAFLCQNIILILVLVDVVLSRLQMQIAVLRYLSYFYQMNLALLIGWFKSIKGVQHDAWQPTKRN
jgi:cellulose synthase/poly-beta-1,6-N-acetylglucosamine synthase-like glycosyltransferase